MRVLKPLFRTLQLGVDSDQIRLVLLQSSLWLICCR